MDNITKVGAGETAPSRFFVYSEEPKLPAHILVYEKVGVWRGGDEVARRSLIHVSDFRTGGRTETQAYADALAHAHVTAAAPALLAAAKSVRDLIDNYHPIEGSIQQSSQMGELRKAIAAAEVRP